MKKDSNRSLKAIKEELENNSSYNLKIIYSCIDGKWNKSEPIYGKIIPTQDEYFEFIF